MQELPLPKIKWKKDDPETLGYSSYSGLDEQGNKWYMTANLECVGVELIDGRKGFGWNEREAWKNAHY
jgi:hypothetical protein